MCRTSGLEWRRLCGCEGDRVRRRTAGARTLGHVDLLRSQRDAHPAGHERGGIALPSPSQRQHRSAVEGQRGQRPDVGRDPEAGAAAAAVEEALVPVYAAAHVFQARLADLPGQPAQGGGAEAGVARPAQVKVSVQHSLGDRAVWPRTAVSNRASGPRRSSAAAVVTSFCTDAGTRLVPAFHLKTVAPGAVVDPGPATASGAPHLLCRARPAAPPGCPPPWRAPGSARSSNARSTANVASQPRWMAATAAWVRFATPRRSSTADTCARAVRSETPSRSAICELSRPSTISSSTCLWRAVSRAAGAAGAPLETLLIATVSSAREQFFVRRAWAPSCAAASASAGSARSASTITGTPAAAVSRSSDGSGDSSTTTSTPRGKPRRDALGLTLPDARAPAGEQGRERAHVQTVAPSYKQADACQTLVGFLADGGTNPQSPSVPEEARPS